MLAAEEEQVAVAVDDKGPIVWNPVTGRQLTVSTCRITTGGAVDCICSASYPTRVITTERGNLRSTIFAVPR